MEKNNKLKKKKKWFKIYTSYYFHDIINIEDFDFVNSLLDEETYGRFYQKFLWD